MESGSGASHEQPSTSKRQSEDGGGEPDRKRRQPEVGAESAATERVTTELHRAATLRNASRVEELLEKGFSTRALDEEGRTPLHVALDCGTGYVAHLLAKADAEIDIPFGSGRSLLHYAARHGLYWIIPALLAAGADTRQRDEEGRPAFHAALHRGHEAAALDLLEADIDCTDSRGRSPLHYAAEIGYRDIVATLLEAGADTRGQDEEGRTPLHTALCFLSKGAALLLAEADAENEVLDKNGRSPLHCAARGGCARVAAKLLWSGVRPHEKDGFSRYPLQYALRVPRDKIANMIIAACALQGVPIDWIELKLSPHHLDTCVLRLSECEAELRRMRDARVGESTVSLFEVTTRHPTRLVPRLPVGSIQHALGGGRLKAEYPIYGDLLVVKLRRIKKRKALALRCLGFFSRMLPILCAEVILLYLAEEDMMNFISAMELEA